MFLYQFWVAMKKVTVSLWAFIMIGLLQGFDLFKPKPYVVAEVGDSQLTLAALRSALLPGDTLTRQEWVERIEHWIHQELLYREALEKNLRQDPRVQELLQIAERKILVDHLRMQLDSAIGEISEGDLVRFYEAHPEFFLRDRDVWTVAVVQFPSMREATDYLKNWNPAMSDAILAGKPGILPPQSMMRIEVAGPDSDTCWSHDVRLFQRKQLSAPRVCSGNVQSFMLVDRLDSGSVFTFVEARPRLYNMVLEEQRAQKLAALLVESKNRFPVFSYPAALDSLAPKP